MKVDITAALNKYFKFDILGISGFKNDKDNVVGIVNNDTFFENNNNDFNFVATHEVEYNKKVLGKHPAFVDIIAGGEDVAGRLEALAREIKSSLG